MGKITSIVTASALAVLTACGNTDGGPSLGASLLAGVTGGLLQRQAAPAAPITRDSLAGVNGPVLMAEVPTRGSRGTLVLAQNNAGVAMYVSADNLSLLIRNNALIVGTRGFGPDLMASDITGLAPALVRGSGQYTRVMQFLNGEDRITTDRLTCTIVSEGTEAITILGRAHTTRKMREHCTSEAGKFTNRYWVQDNEVWQSQQWVSRQLGSIILKKIQ